MRCGCAACGAYMVHSEGLSLGCVCPQCGNRCSACLGTDTVISREALIAWRRDEGQQQRVLDRILGDEAANDAAAQDEDYGWRDEQEWQD